MEKKRRGDDERSERPPEVLKRIASPFIIEHKSKALGILACLAANEFMPVFTNSLPHFVHDNPVTWILNTVATGRSCGGGSHSQTKWHEGLIRRIKEDWLLSMAESGSFEIKWRHLTS